MKNKSEISKLLWAIFLFGILQFIYVFAGGADVYPVVNDTLIYKTISQDLLNGEVVSTFHYPILYPLIMLPALAFPSVFWIIMCVINIMVKVLFIFPIYSLLKRIMNKNAIYCTILIIFSPIYFSYSRLILAENLMAPLLVVCVLYHIALKNKLVSDDICKTKKIMLTVLAALLSLSLFWTKYLALVFFPILCIYWCLIYIEKKKYFSFIFSGVLYTMTVLVCLGAYALIYAIKTQTPFNIDLIKLTMGLGIGTGPESVGYVFVPEVKWVICYFLYALLCSVPILVTLLSEGAYSARKKGWDFIFLLCISMTMIYVTARHSTYVSYNQDGQMLKLLGRYVAYIVMLLDVALFLPEGPDNERRTYSKKRKYCLAIVGSICITMVPYLFLYKKLIWKYDENWLDGARGLECIGFLEIGIILCIIYILCSVVAVVLWKKNKLIYVICICFVLNISTIVAKCTLEEKNIFIRYNKDICYFMNNNDSELNVVLCNEYNSYATFLQLKSFYAMKGAENTKTVPIVYNKNASKIIRETAYFMLNAEQIACTDWEERGAFWIKREGGEFVFLRWEPQIFEKQEMPYSIVWGEEKMYLSFEGEKNMIVLSDNIIWPGEYEQGVHKVEIDISEFEGENIKFGIYDLHSLLTSEVIVAIP